MRSKNAFSLIELLVVINIIGIISAVATTSFLQATQRARGAKASAAGRVVAMKVEAFASDSSGRYPNTGPQAVPPTPLPFAAYTHPDLVRLREMGGFGDSPGPINDTWEGYPTKGQYSISFLNSLSFGDPTNGMFAPLLEDMKKGVEGPKPGDLLPDYGSNAVIEYMGLNSIFYDSDGVNYVAYGFARRGNRIMVATKVTNLYETKSPVEPK